MNPNPGRSGGAPLSRSVSIIIPLHNGERFIGAAIESCLRQTWPHKEVIVVDDGSSDGSLAAARRYETAMVRVLHQANAGASAARNKGLQAATGAYVQYLDADDLLAPDKIEAQMRALGASPEGCVVCCGWGKFETSADGATFIPQRVWGDFSPVDWLVTAWSGGGMMQTACWLTPRAVADKAGPWDETLRDNPADDGEYFCRVLLASQGVRFCREARVYYRAPHEGSLSRKLSEQAVHSLFMNCERYRAHLLPREDSVRARRALARNYAGFAYRFHPDYPDLVQAAFARIGELGCVPDPRVGGWRFRLLAGILGFERALRFRARPVVRR